MAKKSKPGRGAAQAGVRELRQNLSVYLARVKRGERLEVTEHGRPVALLLPIPHAATAIEQLAAEGRATLPQGDLLDLGPPPPRPPGVRPLSQILQAMRAEERY
jgi:prevent-host-death family protein